MKVFVVATILAFTLAACGAGVGVNTPIGGAGVQIGVGNVPPPVYYGH
jgi:hypothetical protein